MYTVAQSVGFARLEKARARLAAYTRASVRMEERVQKTKSEILALETSLRECALLEAGYVKVADGERVGWRRNGWTAWITF